MMANKLGLKKFEDDADEKLFADLVEMLQLVETDMSIFYRNLADLSTDESGKNGTPENLMAPLMDAYYVPERLTEEIRFQITEWLQRYVARVKKDGTSDSDRRQRMNAVNPKYVLRNYLAQLAIDKSEEGDHSLVNELLDVLRHPYDEQPEHEDYAAKRPDWARHRAGCSMLSCSS
jgi:uncharacterized protein YdiU (UPF0061 family)